MAAPLPPRPDEPLPKVPDDPGAPVPLSMAAKLLGVDMQRMYNAARLPSFPHPIAHVACLPVYRIGDVRDFVIGRPSDHGGAG